MAKKIQVAIRHEIAFSESLECDKCEKDIKVFYDVYDYVSSDLDFWAEADQDTKGYLMTLCEKCLIEEGFTPSFWAKNS